MFFITCNVLFNGVLLSVLFAVVGGLSGAQVPNCVYLIVGYVICASLSMLGMTSTANSILRLFIGSRAPIRSEMEIIQPALAEVLRQANAVSKSGFTCDKIIIMVTDDKVVNALALGPDTIVFSKMLLDLVAGGASGGSRFGPDEFRAIIAHEVAHLYYRDSVRTTALLFGAIATRISMFIYSLYLMILRIFTDMGSKESRILGGVFHFISSIVFLPVIILYHLGGGVFYLMSMYSCRCAEYRADEFAVVLGYSEALIKVLEHFAKMETIKTSFIEKIIASHPRPMLRIDKIESLPTSTKLKPGGIGDEPPGIQTQNISTNVSRDILSASIWFAIVGVALSIVTIYDYKHPMPKVSLKPPVIVRMAPSNGEQLITQFTQVESQSHWGHGAKGPVFIALNPDLQDALLLGILYSDKLTQAKHEQLALTPTYANPMCFTAKQVDEINDKNLQVEQFIQVATKDPSKMWNIVILYQDNYLDLATRLHDAIKANLPNNIAVPYRLGQVKIKITPNLRYGDNLVCAMVNFPPK